jgi:hypothetical protein
MFDGLLIKIKIHVIEDRDKRYMANQETTSNTRERMSVNIIVIVQTK